MSDPAVIVRDASSRDAPALASLLGELGYPTDVAPLAARLGRKLTRSDEIVLIAERRAPPATTAVGLLALHVLPVLAYAEDLAMITALVVASEARGTGVGRLLVARAEAAATTRGATRLMVTTHVRRADAHAFYERLGFDFTGRRYVKAIGR